MDLETNVCIHRQGPIYISCHVFFFLTKFGFLFHEGAARLRLSPSLSSGSFVQEMGPTWRHVSSSWLMSTSLYRTFLRGRQPTSGVPRPTLLASSGPAAAPSLSSQSAAPSLAASPGNASARRGTCDPLCPLAPVAMVCQGPDIPAWGSTFKLLRMRALRLLVDPGRWWSATCRTVKRWGAAHGAPVGACLRLTRSSASGPCLTAVCFLLGSARVD